MVDYSIDYSLQIGMEHANMGQYMDIETKLEPEVDHLTTSYSSVASVAWYPRYLRCQWNSFPGGTVFFRFETLKLTLDFTVDDEPCIRFKFDFIW